MLKQFFGVRPQSARLQCSDRKTLMPALIQTQEQEKLGKLITNVNLMTSQLELHYFEDTDNEIVFRAREMSEMVSEMYLFTRYVLYSTSDTVG